MASEKSVKFTGATTDGEILDPTTGTKFVLHSITVSVTGTTVVSVYDEADAAATQVFKQRITDGYEKVWRRRDVPWSYKDNDGLYRSAAVNNKLEITYADAVDCYVTIEYEEET